MTAYTANATDLIARIAAAKAKISADEADNTTPMDEINARYDALSVEIEALRRQLGAVAGSAICEIAVSAGVDHGDAAAVVHAIRVNNWIGNRRWEPADMSRATAPVEAYLIEEREDGFAALARSQVERLIAAPAEDRPAVVRAILGM